MPHREIGPKNVVVRAGQILLVTVIGMAFVGMVVGMRQGATVYIPTAQPYEPITDYPNAVPATAYRDFDRRQFGPNRGWQSSLPDLGPPPSEPTETDPHEFVQWDEEARAALVAQRAQRRAFYGAPPVVPHPIDQMGVASCLACHADGRQVGSIRVPQMSHSLMRNCTQCHVEQHSTELTSTTAIRNLFEALEAPVSGSRAWDGAPPTIPHTTFLRDNCLSCHGAKGPDPIRTTHPWRTSCLQCHAPSAEFDQGFFGPRNGFLPPPEVAPR